MEKKSFWSLRILKNFYTASLLAWVVWIFLLDNNNLRVVFSHRTKMKELEREKAILLEKIGQVKKERNEVFGNPKMLEKLAREKFLMRKPKEEVYVIVDENNQPAESKKE